MRPRYYLPKQEFRTRGEIMESSAASFVVKIGGRLLPGTLLYLRGGALEEGEGGREGGGGERRRGGNDRAFPLVSRGEYRGREILGRENFFLLDFFVSGIVFFRAKNEK